MAEDLFGNEISDEEDVDLEVDETPEATEAEPEESTEADGSSEGNDEETLRAEGDEPEDVESARKYWQAAYTKSRQKDREKYSGIEAEHKQYQQLLANFYQDDNYAKQVLAQRFPQLAQQLNQSGQSSSTNAGTPTDATGLTERLKQKWGEFGFLADGLGDMLKEAIDSEVARRTAPLEQRTIQQSEAAKRAEENRLLTEMDGKHPGWEESVGAKMRELDDFLASENLTHPQFGNKYELYYRLLNPDSARVDAAREMSNAARRRTGLGRTGRSTNPNIDELVRKAESSSSAFRAAAKAALEDTV